MSQWFMLSVVGKDRPGIVAAISQALLAGGCPLGEASMVRLGGNFTILLMVAHDGDEASLRALVAPVTDRLGLRLHVDRIDGELHHHHSPDVRISVHGADRPGIVARVTGALAEAGLDILDLESDVAGSSEKPIYIMQIEGAAQRGVEALEAALDSVRGEGIEARLEHIETMIG